MRIIYLDIDSLRADHLPCYGYGRALTPHLDRLARRSVRFERCFCADSPCMPSRANFTSQQFGITNGVTGHWGEGASFRFPLRGIHPPERPLLGGHLQRHGIFTASISCFAERHLAYWFQGNFRETLRPTLSTGNDEDAEDVTAAACGWLDRHAAEADWFLHLNYWDPHTNYVVPPEWVERAAATGPRPVWPDAATIAAHQEIYGPHTATDLHAGYGRRSPVPATMPDRIASRADLDRLIDGYDAGILYLDHHLGRLFAHLEGLGILEETAIILTADHGEAFGENGVYAEHAMVHEPVQRIPLLISWPGLTGQLASDQRSTAALVYNLDLGPTLCDLLGLPTPAAWEGASFAAALRGHAFAGHPELYLSHGLHTFQRAVRTSDHCYIHTLHPGCFRVDREMLYDLAADPHLTRNLAKELPALTSELRGRLEAWCQAKISQPGGADSMMAMLDPGPTLYANPDSYQTYLTRTGRADLAADLRARQAGHAHSCQEYPC